MENDVPKFLRFCDLQDRGLVQSHAGLRHLQVHEGFPLGRLLGPSTRVWTVAEVNEWLANRPVDPLGKLKNARSGLLRQGATGGRPDEQASFGIP